MSAGNGQIIAPGGALFYTESFPVDTGILQSASVSAVSGAVPGFSGYVTIGIMTDGVGPSFVSAVLYSGYLHLNQPKGWFGRLRLGPSDRIFVIYRTVNAANVRVAWRTIKEEQ